MPAQSKSQQRFFGVVKAMQKGDVPKKGEAGKVAKSMTKKDVDDFASTKHKGKPEKVKKETKVRALIRKMVREIMKEDFAGSYPKSMRKKFNKIRKEQSQVLGYTLTGTDDVKTEIDDATVNEGKLEEKCWKGYEKKGMKKMFGKKYPNCVKKEEKIKETTVRISSMKDVSFAGRDRLQLLGKKGKLGLDRKSVSALVKAVRSILGRSFTTHEEKLNEAKIITLPNGVKAKIEFKGITLQQKGKKPVFLDRREMMTFFKATQKYMKQGLTAGKIKESQVAKTILQQLGGNRFIAMTGAKNLGSTNKSLQFKIGRNSKSISHVIITLKSTDLYDVEFIRMRGVNRKVVKKLKGVYADQLQTMFKKYTGMNVRL